MEALTPRKTVGTERTAVTVGEDSNPERTKGKVPLGMEESAPTL